MLHIRQVIHALKQRLGMSTILDEHINWAIEQQITQIPISSTKIDRLIRIVQKGLPRDA